MDSQVTPSTLFGVIMGLLGNSWLARAIRCMVGNHADMQQEHEHLAKANRDIAERERRG